MDNIDTTKPIYKYNGIYSLDLSDVKNEYFIDWFFKMEEKNNDNKNNFNYNLLVDDPKYGIFCYGYFINELEGIVKVRYVNDEDYYAISMLFVNKNRQGSGIGQKLLKYVINKFGHKTLKLNVFANNTVAIHIYEKFGFKIVDQFTYVFGEDKQYIGSKIYKLARAANSTMTESNNSINEQILEQLINIIKEGNYDYPYTTQFVIQDHYASTHHFDLRIKRDNYLASWAIPKARLPEDENEKILAIRTNDHNLSWLKFEGTIPEGNYGAGKVTIYDSGDCLVHQWTNVITVTFNGNKIKDTYSLIKTNNKKYIIVKKKLKYERVLDDGLGL